MSSNPFISGIADFYPPPYSFEKLTSITFAVQPTSLPALQGVCDDFLNAPLNRTGTNVFVPNLNRVLVTFSRFPEVESKNSPAAGYLSYQEVSLILMIYDGKNAEVGMFSPVLFLDGPETGTEEYFATWPVALGREVFGLPKTRGEIHFETDLTGSVKSLFPSGSKMPLELEYVIKVGLVQQIEKQKMLLEIGNLDETVSSLPDKSFDLVSRKKELLRDFAEANNDLRRIRQNPMIGEPYHPFELVNKIWGSEIAQRRLRMKGSLQDVPQYIGDALEKVKHGVDHAELAPAVEKALKLGFFDALHMTVMPGRATRPFIAGGATGPATASSTTGPYTAAAGWPLLGLRQLHAPGDFQHSDHRDVIKSPFKYLTAATPAANAYVVEFPPTPIKQRLTLLDTYTVQKSDTVTYTAATAEYGATIETVT